MKLNISGTNVEVTDAEYDRVEEHLARVERYVSVIDAVQVNITKERHLTKVEVHLSSRNMKLFGTASTPKPLISIDKAMDRIVVQCRRYRKKLRASRKHSPQYSSVVEAGFELSTVDYSPESEEEVKPVVIRSERQFAKPMDLEEAIMQMDLLNSESFVFTDAKTERVSVLYRRKDKQLGLIET